ncbi:succinate--CoA ligase [GDP-forming] subunit beta, mitochondrial-like [Atheta coriaria]|uniref:succinate--CoA ligase [GDP-forming] subunit beta, mitochondrial-like n=1 Tax=Dalotia coriaria TaxID=877792 RepID=UPI0031F3A1F7
MSLLKVVGKIPQKTNILLLLNRHLNLFEYQCKTLLAENDCTVEPFCVLERGKYGGIQKIAAPAYVVKAQILPGDRGRGIFTSGFRGGIHITKSRREAVEIAQRMLGQTLVTNQTSDRGVPVDKVIVAECLRAIKQKYICFALDPIHGPSIYVSDESNFSFDAKDGLSKSTKGKMAVYRVRLSNQLPEAIMDALITKLNFGQDFTSKVQKEIMSLWKVFRKYHILYLAVNPLSLSTHGDIVCLDAKITIDNAALKLPHIAALLADMKDNRSLEDNLQDKINYIHLGGNIGCIVNGAGLAMGTNDLLNQYGGKPANFSNLNLTINSIQPNEKDNIHIAIEALTRNPRITSILVNINWHNDCTQIATSLLETKLKLPIVMRLKGINDEAAWKQLETSTMKIYRVNATEEAVRKVIALSDVSLQLLHNKVN